MGALRRLPIAGGEYESMGVWEWELKLLNKLLKALRFKL